MGERRRYRKKAGEVVIAVRLDLDTDGLVYRKWGGEQRAKPGDWLVENGDETYTVDADVFARTHRAVSPGVYRKVTPVWAEKAAEKGSVETLEGRSHYEPGHYVVSNEEDGTDAYCITAERFEAMYEPDDD